MWYSHWAASRALQRRLGDADAQPDPSTCKNDCVNCCTDCDYDDIAPPDDTAYYSQPGSYYAPQ